MAVVLIGVGLETSGALDGQDDSNGRLIVWGRTPHSPRTFGPEPTVSPAPLASIEGLLAAKTTLVPVTGDPEEDRGWPYFVRIMRQDGSGERILANGATSTWSRDGRRLVFKGSGTGAVYSETSDLVAIDVTTGAAVGVGRLASDDMLSCFPIDRVSWSASDDLIAYPKDDPASEIYVSRADGAGEVALTQGCTPSWSPIGWRMAYTIPSGVIIADALAGKIIARAPPGVGPLSWSPDGKSLTYAAGSIGGHKILVADTESGKALCEVALTPDENLSSRDDAASWSPDSQQFAVTIGSVTGNLVTPQVWLVDVPSCERRFLTVGQHPSWSPRSGTIAYQGYDDDSGAFLIYTIPSTGGEARLLTTGFAPAWSPDGEWLAFTR